MTTKEEAIATLRYLVANEKHCRTQKDIEMLTICIDSLDKQIPKKPLDVHLDDWTCPNCFSECNADEHRGDDYCPICGQAIDWSAEDE